jgi:UTP-glucose-1-phosphate uridylyltransferase
MHVLTPAVMDILGEQLAGNPGGTLSSALAELAQREQCLALHHESRRYDLGARDGLLTAHRAGEADDP